MKYVRYFQKFQAVVKIMCGGGKVLNKTPKKRKKEKKKNHLHVEKSTTSEKATKHRPSFEDMMCEGD